MITIPKNTYNDLQKLTKDFTNYKGGLPILNTWQLQARDGILCATSTNLDITAIINTNIPSNECTFVVNKDIKPSSGNVILENAKLTLGNTSITPSFDEYELPPLPNRNNNEEPITTLVDCKPLVAVIDAVSTDEARPVLTHIHITPERLEAGDGPRLHIFSFPSGGETFIPLKIAKWLIKNKAEGITIYNKMITAAIKDYEYGCELYYKLEENMNYPNVNAVIPKFYPEHSFTFLPKDITDVLIGYAPAKEDNGLIVISFNENELMFSKDNTGIDNTNWCVSTIVSDCTITKSTGVNHKYLRSAMKILDQCKDATFSQRDFNALMLITQDDITIVIMPMHINL